METVTLNVTRDKIQKALEDSIDNILKSSYGNPVKDMVEKALKDKEGEIRKVVDSILSEAVNSPDFKEKIGAVLVTRMVESAMKK